MISTPPTAPLASNAGIDIAVSPDGRKIVYFAESQLYLRYLHELLPTPIAGTEGASYVFFSPDGESVAFFTPGKLKKVSLLGGPPMTLFDITTPSGGSWGSGNTIVFSALVEGFVNLYRASASGGEPELLAAPSPDIGEVDYLYPDILPGGQSVLFTIFGSDGLQAAVLSLETGEKKILVQGARQARYANSGHLVYEVPISGALAAVPFNLGRLEVTGEPSPVLEGIRNNPSFAVDYALSGNGTLVYVPLHTVEQRLVWVDREGLEEAISQEDRTFATPRLSPDGNQISVTVYENDGSRNVWVSQPESNSFSRLTFEGDFNATQIWSPDGKWIAFQSGKEGRRGISRQLADGSGRVEQLTDPTTLAQIPDSWSPNGDIAFTSVPEILVLPMDSNREPRPLVNGCCGAFSPDGQWFAYVSNDETGRNHIYVIPFLDPEVKRLISGKEGGGEPVWSRDGTEIFYRSGDKMMVVPVRVEPTFSAERPSVLFEGSYVKTQFMIGKQYYDVAPDGQRFLMIKAREDTSQINVVQNWFEELKRLVPTE
jgi:Tol biopolymer transport system component